MTKKNITINDLAVMVQKGFDNTATKGQFENLEIRMNNLENEMNIVRKHQITHTIYRDEFENLEVCIKYIENMLNLPNSKKH